MYTRRAGRRGFKVSWPEESAGEEAGIKSCASTSSRVRS
jgi:peptide chain release factor 2